MHRQLFGVILKWRLMVMYFPSKNIKNKISISTNKILLFLLYMCVCVRACVEFYVTLRQEHTEQQ
jgi:hypothetical protein